MQSYKNFLLEKRYLLNLSDIQYSFDNSITYEIDKTEFFRLKHLLIELIKSDSYLVAEKITEMIFNANNLNYYNLSFPFVDLISKKGKYVNNIELTKPGELINVKYSKTSSIQEVISETKLRISGMLLYFIEKINKGAKNNRIIKSNISNAVTQIMKTDGVNEGTKEFFINLPYYILLTKRMIDENNLENIEKITIQKTYKNLILAIYKNFYNENFEFKNEIITQINLPDNINQEKKEILKFNEQISYCGVYYKNGDDFFDINIEKSNVNLFYKILLKSLKIWIDKPIPFLLEGKKTLSIFNKKDIFNIWENDSDKELEHHIKILIKSNEKIERGEKDLFVNTINKIKSIDNNEKNKDLLKFISAITNIFNNSDDLKKDEYIKKFNNFVKF